ncbi:MAG: hypothetical protein U9Q68_04605 [Euryarchaeota archaeon]|nr:hypothetical protein [Euryarchaeota archaeon]
MNKNQTVDAKLSQFERNKYFYGKLMTVRDFETEQSYLNEKRYLLSRLIHGTGVVCGIEVIKTVVDGGKLTLELTPGVAIDCCGREIVVGDDYRETKLEANGTVAEGTYYVYLEYEECDKESVPVPANSSACEEACCYNRVKEIFNVVVSQESPGEVEVKIPDEPSEGVEEPETKQFASDYFKEHLTTCPRCENPQVLLAVIDVTGAGVVSVDETETLRYRALVYNNPMLYELISSHLLDLNNPHEVDAGQVGALESVENLSNPGGNIDIDRTNAITISTETPANADPKIIIGENHSTDKNNPHEVTATQTGALESVDGVQNPGGDVDLVAGENIIITPKAPTPTSITIASTAGVDPATTVTSVGKDPVVGASGKYAREDHVHDLADEVVEFGKLAAALQDQLNTVYQYLRERALKCTVGSFSEVGEKFESEAAIELSKSSKKLVDKRVYEDEDAFMDGVKDILELEHDVCDEIEESATYESFKDFYGSVKYLEKALESGDSLKVATEQDEVCFYALLLETGAVGPDEYKEALECTVSSFSDVGKKFESEAAMKLSEYSQKLVDEEVYEDEAAFMGGMKDIFEMENSVCDEIEESATEDSFEVFYGSVKSLNEALESGDSLKVATAQIDVCHYALLLETGAVGPDEYKEALECTVSSFSDVGKKFESEAAMKLSEYSQKLVDEEVYEDEAAFMGGMKDIFEMENSVCDEIEESATEDSFEVFYGSVKSLNEALESGDSLKVATAQIDVCHYALLLEGRRR